jgi:hypothetical protein
MQINGTLRHGTRPLVTYDAVQDGESWAVTVRSAANRYEARTWQPSPWRAIEELCGQALDGMNKEVEPGKWDMNKRLDKPLTPTPLRRRGRLPAGSVPTWRPPE